MNEPPKASYVIQLAEKRLGDGILAMTGSRRPFWIKEVTMFGATVTLRFIMENNDGDYVWHFNVEDLTDEN